MKKTFVLCLSAASLVLWTAFELQAVEFKDFGIKAGYTSGSLRAIEEESEYTVEKYTEGGFAAGVFVSIPLVSFLSLRPEVLFFQKGGEYDVGVPVGIPGVQVNVFETRSMNYIEIPVMLKARIPLFRGVGTSFLIGPSLGISLSGRVKQNTRVQAFGFTFDFRAEDDIKEQLRAVELSFALGGDFDIELGGSKLFIEQRFFFGLKPNPHRIFVPAQQFIDSGFPVSVDIVQNLDFYNYVLFVSLGYAF